METPKEELLSKVDAESFYQQYYPELEFNSSGEGTKNVNCFMHEDDKPSLSINAENGGKCHGCGGAFTDIISFYYQFERKNDPQVSSYDRALYRMYKKYIRPIVSPNVVKRWNAELLKNNKMKAKLAKRHIHGASIVKHGLGYDPEDNRIAIPITNALGWVTDVRKVKLTKGGVKNFPYDYLTAKQDEAEGKVTHGKGGRLFPICNIDKQNITICEGEFDAILLDAHGFNGVTAGGVTEWRRHADKLKGKDVVIMFDNDAGKDTNPGQAAAKKLMEILYPVCRSVKNVLLPNGDVTDFFVEGGTADDLRIMAGQKETPETVEMEEEVSKDVTVVPTVAALLDPKYYGKEVTVEARLTGEKEEFYSLPRDYSFNCPMDRGDACNNCIMTVHSGRVCGSIIPGSDASLAFIGAKDGLVEADLRAEHELPGKCKKLLMRRESVTAIHHIAISPSMDRDAQKTEIDKLTVLNMGEKLEVNSEYRFSGRVTHDPNTQKTTFLVSEAEEKELSFRSFVTPSEEKRDDLRQKFGPEEMTVDAIMEKHWETMDLLAHNVTYIYGRPHLHSAIDLTFMSALEINFDGVDRNSYGETVIIGDTNTGKNEVLDRMCAHYGSGVVVDSGSTTKAGLIGGSDKNGFFSWGLYVQQHGKLIGLDEGSHLSETIGTLRCIREGKADYTTCYAKRQTVCKSRLVILANDPGGALSENPFPIVALPTLFNKGADISRFSSAYFMREEDVSSEIMNRSNPDSIETDITKEDFQIRLANAWSLTADQIEIGEEATKEVYEQGAKMSAKYSSKIPLVQASTSKKKLSARAVALASSQYNMNEDGTKLVVLPEHVIAARLLLEEHYDSDACQYNDYSNSIFINSKITSVKMIDEIFEAERTHNNGNGIDHSIQHLLAQRDLDADYISDSFMHSEMPTTSRRILKTLVVNRCVEKKNSTRVYTKTKAFVDYLREKGRNEEANKLSDSGMEAK